MPEQHRHTKKQVASQEKHRQRNKASASMYASQPLDAVKPEMAAQALKAPIMAMKAIQNMCSPLNERCYWGQHRIIFNQPQNKVEPSPFFVNHQNWQSTGRCDPLDVCQLSFPGLLRLDRADAAADGPKSERGRTHLKLLPHHTSPKNCFHPASRHDRGMTSSECAEHVKSKSMAM